MSHEKELQELIDTHIKDGDKPKRPKHEFLSFVKDKIEHLTHKHGLDEAEQGKLHAISQSEETALYPTPTPSVDPQEGASNGDSRSELFLNYLNEDQEAIEPLPLYEVTESVLHELEVRGKVDELVGIFSEKQATANAKGFLNRLLSFKKLYTRKRDGEVDYFEKALAYPPADLVNDIRFALIEQGLLQVE